ncbi:MAG: PD40 domain-containing protein [Chitinophagaceae bacterium]|nr:PD40 domain-containing protein [Chitinophagaceae bacterium]
MKKIIISYVLISLSAISGAQQIDAGLFRFPDVSHTQIVFTYANDIWIMPKTGGTAQKLSSPAGLEVFPKFSPDGKTVAFSANYDGNNEIYTLPVTGGVPERLTYHGFTERVIDWTPDGKNVLFGSGRESGRNRFGQLFTIPAKKEQQQNYPLLMQSLVLIRQMAPKWPWFLFRRLFVTGNATGVVGKPISIYTIL